MAHEVCRVRLILWVVITVSACVALAQTSNTPAPASTGPITGKQLYILHCASCHGSDGKGGGPSSAQLRVPPPDLTQLAKKNHGIYPEMRVTESIDGEFGKPSHGTAEMPIWGPVFRSLAHGHKDSAQLRINVLVKFLESIQEK